MAEPATVVLLVAIAGAYVLGLSRAWAAAGRGRLVRTSQALVFAGGMIALALALLPPLETRTDHSLTAHMIQHVLLLVVAAPLLALGAPLPTLIWALPERLRPRASAAWRRLLRSHSAHWLVWAGGALVAESLVMVAWHLPVAYRAALHHDGLHVAEHASFLVTAVVFSWAVGVGSARRHGSAVAVVFVAALPGSALGAALTLATRQWYAEYPSLADQQMAGVVMWAFAGVAYVVAAACLFGVWLSGLERDTPGRPLVPVATP
ncbi:MAG: cytochrome c oxidase assembly protein [Acidimicrobiales bacterium]